MKITSKKLFISALLVMMLLLCINTASADDTLNQNLTLSDNTANDIAQVTNDENVNAEDSAEKLSASGDTYVVDANGEGDYTSISDAVSAATGGETILIKNGEYTESARITLTKSLNFIGESQDGVKITSSATNQGIFQATEFGVVLSFKNLTFTNVNSGTSSNVVMKIGGNKNVDITNCNFIDCSGKFGAIQLYTTGTATVDNCKIENFKSTATAGTGGIYISGEGNYSIKNTVIDNSRFTGASGYMQGIIYVYGKNSNTTLTNVTISNAKGSASSVIKAYAKVTVNNSRIVNNTVEKSATGYNGESIFYSYYNANNPKGEIIIEQSVIADNTAPAAFVYSNVANAKTTINYCNIHDNTWNTFATSGTVNVNNNYWGSNTLPEGVTATTWVVEDNGEYKLNDGSELEKTIPELNDVSDDETTRDIIYVALSRLGGSDDNDGLTKQTPVVSINHALELLPNGGTIILLDSQGYGFTIGESIAIDKNITLIGESRDGVLVRTTAETAPIFVLSNSDIDFKLKDISFSIEKDTNFVYDYGYSNNNVNIENCVIFSPSLGMELLMLQSSGELNFKNNIINTVDYGLSLFHSNDNYNLNINNNIILANSFMNNPIISSGSSTVNADNNYWGTNTPNAGVPLNNYIIAVASADESDVAVGEQSKITVSLNNLKDSTGNIQKISYTLPNYPPTSRIVTRNLTTTLEAETGSLDNTTVNFNNGIATVIYTAGNTAGEDTVKISINNNEIDPITLNIFEPYTGPIYVSAADSDDDNIGSEDKPVTTIAKAIELAAIGSCKIIIKEGTYTIAATLKVDNDLDIAGEGNVIVNGNSKRIIENNANLNLTNIKFTGGYDTSACVLLNKGNATLESCEVYSNIHNTAYSTSIIRNNNDINTLKINNSKFHDNSAIYGTIYNNKGTVILNNSEIYNNDMSEYTNALASCALYNLAGKTTIENTIIKDNKGRRIVSSTASGFGASQIKGELNIINTTFDSNTAKEANGGAIYAENSIVNIINSIFNNNIATKGSYSGGQGTIYSQGSTLNIESSLFKDNSAQGGGNDIYMYSGSLDMVDSVLLNSNGYSIEINSDNSPSVNVNNNYWGDNTKTNVGSGINVNTWIILNAEYTPEEVSNGDEVTIKATFDKTNSTSGVNDYTGKIADGLEVSFASTSGDIATTTTKDGSAIVKYTIKEADEEFTVTSNNSKVVLPITKVTPSGIIYVSNAGDDSKDGLSEENAVATLNHAIEIATSKIIILSGSYSENGLTVDKDLEIIGQGTVVIDGSANKIITNTANLNLTGISFTNGLMNSGYVANLKCVIYSTGSLTINGCVFYNNKVASGSSSVIYNERGTLTVKDSEFYGNGAANGVVYNNYGNILVNNSNFHDNSAEYSISYGTAINNANGIATIVNSKFTKNNGRYGTVTARTTYNSESSASITIENCIFTENVAGNYGGAVDIEAVNPGRASANIKNCTFIDNVAKKASEYSTPYAGAAYISCADVDIEQSVFINNKAIDSKGQDIYASNAQLTVKDSVILNENGNSIEIAASSLDSTTVTANDNWWGTNDKPTNIGDGVTVDNWVTMDASMTPSQAQAGEEVTITATFSNDKLPENVINVTFTSTSNKLNEKVSVIDGKASVTYTIDAADTAINVHSTNAEVIINIEAPEIGVIYVSPEGNDDNNGLSELSPIKNIAKAIELANNGIGKIILLEGIHTIDDTLTITQDLDIEGKGTVIIDGENNKKLLSNSAKLNLTNIKFINAKGNFASAIDNTADGDLFINNCDFYSNTATATSSGNIIRNNGNLLINGSIFHENIASRGIIGQMKGELTILESEFNNNSKTSGFSAIYVSGANSVLIDNSSFKNNAFGSGGALYFSSSATFSVDIKNSIFTNNSATNGGAIGSSISSGNVAMTIANCTFIDNKATNSGGAFYTAGNNGKPLIKDSLFINNTATNGNSIYINAGKITVSNSVILSDGISLDKYNQVNNNDINAENNYWGDNTKANVGSSITVSNWIIMNATFTPDDAVAGNEIVVTATFNKLNSTNGITDYDGTLPDGFDVIFTSTSGKLNEIVKVKDGKAIITSYTVDANDKEIIVKSLNDEIILPFDLDAGKIFVLPGASNSNPGTRDAPVGTIKHALEIANGQIVLLEGVHKVDYLGIISDDLTITGEGNAVIDAQNTDKILYVGEEANVVINNVVMINGYSTGDSGALLGNNNNLTLINCILANSSTADTLNGGAIYSVGKLTLINTTIANCSARLGGAIFTNAGGALGKQNSITLINSTLENNIAYGNVNNGGGAIFAQQIVELTIENTSFINNKAQSTSSGGAIFISHSGADIKIIGSEFINNSAKNSGGAIYRAGTSNYEREGSMTITGTLFENNTCGGDGGAVYVRATTLNIADSVLINNKDANGLAVYGYKTEQVAPVVTLNDNWWGSNNSPKDLVGGNGYKPTLTRWAILTVENASEIKAGETVKLTVSINKYTDGTSNGTLTNHITVPRTAEFTTNLDEFGEVLENGELIYDYTVSTGLKYLAVTVDGESVVLYVVTTNTTVIVDPVDGKKYDKVPVTITVKASDDSIVDMGEIELYVENKLIATLPVNEGKAVGEIVISQNDGAYNLTAKYVEKTGLFNNNQTNTTLTVSGIVDLVNSTFFNFFDENGLLRDEITEDELIFHGDFSGLGLNVIIIPRAITIKGDDAVLYNLSYSLVSNDVKLENITLIADGADFSFNYGAVIYAYGENIEINNVTVNYTAPADKEAFGIHAIYANGFKLTDSEINFNGTNTANLVHHAALILRNSNDVEIKGNIINASLPARNVAYNYYYPQLTGIDQDLVLGIGIQGGENINFTDNKVLVNAKTSEGTYATIDSFMVDSVKNLLIKNNNFTQTDFSGEGKAGYANCIDLYNFNGVTVEGNNILINTTTGAEGAGTAYPIQATGPYTGLVINKNNLTAISKGPALGIYSQNYDGITDIIITSNNINVTGYATSNPYALVSGMELQDTNVKVYDNIIYSQSISDYNDVNQLFGISYAQDIPGTHTFDIQNNTIYTEGKYAVFLRTANDTKVTGNILYAHELVSDAAANISNGSNNIIENNYPRTVENITVKATDVFEGQSTVITVNVPNATGNVTIKVNGKEVTTIDLDENGNAVFETAEYGNNYTVNVTYNGNAKYYPISNITTFNYIDNVVTQEDFNAYFDEYGNLRSEVPYDELIFKGDFADLVSYITIDKPLTITGEDAKLKNIGFIIAGDDVTLDKLELVASNLADLITIAGSGATISNSNITYDTEEGNAIRAYYGADNLKIINNNIKFTSTIDDYDVEIFANAISIDSGSDIFTRYDEDFIEGVIISNNNITAIIPSFTVDSYEHEYYVMGLSSINGVRINGVTDLELTNNNINVTTNALNGKYPTFQALYIACADGIVDGNNISMIDTFTPEGKDVYLYAMEIIYDDLTISNNNFNISTAGGIADAGAAYAIQAVDSTIILTKNNITSVSNGPNIGVYLPSSFGAPCDLTMTDNNIEVTGLATDKYTGLVTGVEVQTGNVVIKNNNITTHNKGSYDENNYIYGVSYAQKGRTSDFVITNNNITTDGHYTISFYEVNDAKVTDNYLISHDLTGDESVEIKKGSDNTVENNYPTDPKLTINVENIIVGSEAEITINTDAVINGEVKVTVNGEEHNVTITDGTGKLIVPGLTAGTYNVTAEYIGDNIKFVSDKDNASFTVNKLIISADDIELGESVIINITVNENITGEVKVIVDGKEYTVAITEGAGNLTVENLTASTYKITAAYEGNDDFASADNETTFKVNKLNTPISITIGDAVIGENTVVNISVPGATGNVTLIVDGEETTIPLDADGNATYTIENITAGDHNIVAIYLGDDNNAANYNKTTVSVDKVDTTLTIDPIETQTIDEPFTIKVNNETPVTVTINGKEYDVDSEGNVNVDDLTAGDYIVNVVSAETDKYNANNATATFTVEKATPTVNIAISELVDDEVTVTVTLPDDATGTILINVNGTVFAFSTDDVNNGKIVLAASKYNLLKASVTTTTPYNYQIVLTKAGEYKINATFLGNDKYNNASSETVTVNVAEKPEPVDTNVEVNISDDKNSIAIDLPENATGNITVKVDGKEIYNGLANETENVSLGELPVGEHTVEVIYSGDENHTAKEVSETVNIEKTETEITADNVNITEGETATITVNIDSKATGLVLIDINGAKYYGEITDGKATVDVTGLTAGNYTADVKYVGDDKYANASTAAVINVDAEVVPVVPEKVTPEANVTVPDESEAGETPVVDVSLPENATGNVSVSVDGKEVANVPLVNGSANVPLENLTAGDHDVEVKYSGDDNYAPVTASGNISIAKVAPTITAETNDISEGETATVTVNAPGDATGLVLVDINGIKYYGEIANGKATVSVPGLAAGEYNADVKYVGDDKYANASTAAKIKVTAKETPVTPDKVTPNANITIPSTANAGEKPVVTVELPADATGNVSVIVDGKETIVPVLNGTASVPLENLTPGAHSVEVKYIGDDKYSPISEVSAIAVNDIIPIKKDTILSANATLTRVANDHTKMGENGTDYYVTLTDVDGNPLFNKTIQIAINGVHYYVQTDEGGRAYQQVNMESANVYTYAFAFQGDDDYNAAPLNSTRLTVTKKPTGITAKAKTFKASAKTKKITVTLTTSKNPYDGKVYLAKGKKLTLTINGKTYSGKTNAKNQVTFSIKLTKKGKYTAKVKFAGSKIYKAVTKKVKITIK